MIGLTELEDDDEYSVEHEDDKDDVSSILFISCDFI
jgi:hypothetical protein